MQYKTLILWIFIFSSVSLTAQTAENYLAETRQLIEQKQYRSAWETLHSHAEEIPFSDMMILKSRLSIRYYSSTNMFQTFTFDDLEAGETLKDIRRNQPKGEVKLFDPAGGLLTALKEDPGNGEIHYWLGEFYFTVLHLIGEESGMSEKELQHQIILHYRKALELGEKDEYLSANLGYTELTVQDWSSAAVHFNQALEANPENTTYRYNLATAYANAGDTEKAGIAIEKALESPSSPPDRADALFLGSTIALMKEDGDLSRQYLEEGKELSPKDYRFPERLIQICLVQEDWEGAVANSISLFDLYPHSPESCQTILNHFNAFQGLSRLENFFSPQVQKYRDDPEALGNLLYHRGVVSLLNEKVSKGRNDLEQASAEFGKVFEADHQIFGIIQQLLNQSTASPEEE